MEFRHCMKISVGCTTQLTRHIAYMYHPHVNIHKKQADSQAYSIFGSFTSFQPFVSKSSGIINLFRRYFFLFRAVGECIFRVQMSQGRNVGNNLTLLFLFLFRILILFFLSALTYFLCFCLKKVTMTFLPPSRIGGIEPRSQKCQLFQKSVIGVEPSWHSTAVVCFLFFPYRVS